MKNVVIVGGGFGGLSAAKVLAAGLPSDHRLVIVSEREYFTFKPLLHEVATGVFGSEVVCESIPSFFSAKNFWFVKANATKVDIKKQLVYIDYGSRKEKLPYAYLVIATGSLSNFYKVPGAESNCFKLETADDALLIRKRIVNLFKSGQKRHGENDSDNSIMTFVIVGAGPTGIEFSAELSEFASQLSRQFKRNFEIIIIERFQTILPQTSEKFKRSIMQHFSPENISVMTGRAVTKVDKEFVVITGAAGKQSIGCDFVLWAAGIKPSELVFTPKVEKNSGFLVVDEYLRIQGLQNVFAVGDCALVKDKNGGYVPWLAQAAVAEGKIAASNIVAAVNNHSLQTFVLKSKGFILPIGKGVAVADLVLPVIKARLFFDGFPAWWLNRTIYLLNMLAPRHKLKVAWLWMLGLFRKRIVN